MTQEGYHVIIMLPTKSKMAAAKKQCFLRFVYLTESSLPPFKVCGLQNDHEFGISVNTYH